MSRSDETSIVASLRSRIAELEGQLVLAGNAEQSHLDIEDSLRRTLAYTKSIVDTVREPLLVLDRGLRVRTASRSFCQTFGVSATETEGRIIYDLGDGEWNIPELRRMLEQVLPREKSFQDYEVSHEFPRLGHRVMLLNARELWREGNHTSLVLLAIEDITDRKRMLEELIRSNEDLQSFAYVAAHDLRSPLNSSLRLAQLLERRIADGIGAHDRGMLNEVISGLQRLGALMQDILAFAELGNAPQRRVLVSLQEPLSVALKNLEHHIKENDANIILDVLPEVMVDRTQMIMVFQNLIGNALKYRRAEPLKIRIGAKRDGAEWCLSVTDNGQGFAPVYAQDIFEPFKRLHGKDRPGSGIGLATCKRIIDRLGGRIWAESVPGQGSTFYFTLPVTAPAS